MRPASRAFFLIVLAISFFTIPQLSGAQGETIWSADMLIVDYQNGTIGAPLARLFSNKVSSEGLEARWL